MSFQLQTTNKVGLDILLRMLTYKRPAKSATEAQFILDFITPTGARPDGFGNYWLDVGTNPTLLFSSHTDTVHHDDGFQALCFDEPDMVTAKIFADTDQFDVDEAMKEFALTGKMPKISRAKLTNCLGADCTTGIWLMLEMIKAGIEGRYVFHREEECGGNGSDYVAKKEPERLKGIKAAIAFDRKGYTSIITHQMNGRCCSDEFGKSLAKALDMNHKMDDTGTFTDTANYTDLIGECTNLSVGYFDQHGPKEAQDTNFALVLRDALLCADFSDLVFKREAGEEDPDYYGYSKKYGGWSNDRYQNPKSLYDLVYRYPEQVAAILEAWGVEFEELDSNICDQLDFDDGGDGYAKAH